MKHLLLGVVVASSLAGSAHAQTKLRVDVSDYGAVGDGSTDDTSAIQSAVDTHGAATVYLPPGTYLLDGTVTIYGGQELVGDSATLLTKRTDGTSSAQRVMISADGPASDITVRGLRFEDAGSGFNTPIFLNGTNGAFERVTVDGCEFVNFSGYAIRHAGTEQNLGRDFAYTDNTHRDCRYTCANISHWRGVVVSGNRFYNGGIADGQWNIYSSSNVSDAVYNGNVFVGGRGGLKISSSTTSHRKIVVSNNTFSDVDNNAMVIGAVQGGLVIAGNVIEAITAVAGHVKFQGGVEGLVMTGNVVDFRGTTGTAFFWLELPEHAIVDGNMVYDGADPEDQGSLGHKFCYRTLDPDHPRFMFGDNAAFDCVEYLGF